jgi:Protein of unknown function (DUF3716)
LAVGHSHASRVKSMCLHFLAVFLANSWQHSAYFGALLSQVLGEIIQHQESTSVCRGCRKGNEHNTGHFNSCHVLRFPLSWLPGYFQARPKVKENNIIGDWVYPFGLACGNCLATGNALSCSYHQRELTGSILERFLLTVHRISGPKRHSS